MPARRSAGRTAACSSSGRNVRTCWRVTPPSSANRRGVGRGGLSGHHAGARHAARIRAHTARPFAGRNAIHRLVPLLQRVAEWTGREVVLDGCTYAEQLQAVAVEGGVAANVVPDEARLTLNHRYARTGEGKRPEPSYSTSWRDLDLESGDTWEVLDTGDGAPPSLGHPLLHALVEKSGAAPKAKVGWTDVASFWEHGVPPQLRSRRPLLAHHPDERVSAGSWSRPTGSCTPSSPTLSARQETMIVPIMYWWMLQM